MKEEKRIYVIIAETVDTPGGTVVQVPGRMAAQGGHALSRMKMHRLADVVANGHNRGGSRIAVTYGRVREMADEKITTIWKSCRDSRELDHIAYLLNGGSSGHRRGIGWYDFKDENDELYGVGYHPSTAIATMPISPEQAEGIVDYLPLWSPEDFKP